MTSGRPGGNPELEKYQFDQQYEWDEPCTAKMTLRLPPSMYDQLKTLPKWQERVRKAISAMLSAESNPIELESE